MRASLKFQQLFNKKYQDHFPPDSFGRDQKPVFPSMEEERHFNRMVDNFYKRVSWQYSPGKEGGRWNLIYWFIGELCSDLQEIGSQKCLFFSFDKPSKTIEISSEYFFTYMSMLRDELSKKMPLKDSGFRKWFKDDSYDGFLKNLKPILKRKDLVENIVRGRPVQVPFVMNQEEALKLLGGKLDDEKIEQILQIIQKRCPGKHKKRFTSVEGVKKEAEKFFDECKQIFVSDFDKRKNYIAEDELYDGWHHQRITKRKCLKNLLYWGLMGTISYRKDRVIEVSSKREKKFFSLSYRLLRRAAESLGYIKCLDESYCPGVRCKSWAVKAFMPQSFKVGYREMELNDLERKYIELQFDKKAEFAIGLSNHALQYMTAKSKVYSNHMRISGLNRIIRSRSYAAREFGKENGVQWTKEKWGEVNETRTMVVEIRNKVKDFYKKFSDARTFDWRHDEYLALGVA